MTDPTKTPRSASDPQQPPPGREGGGEAGPQQAQPSAEAARDQARPAAEPAPTGETGAAPAPGSGSGAASPDEALAAAKARVVDLEAQSEQYLGHLKRLAADFDNYKKRQARDRDQLVASANERLVKDLLPVLDDLERALQAFDEHDPGAVREGVVLVHRALRTLLDREGISEIDPDGAPFDPHEHEALTTQPSPEVAEGTVLQVIQRGFRLGERVIRPARVVVAAGPPGEGD